MTNNLDQFDQSPDFEDADDAAKRGGMKSNLAEAWRTKPIFKLIVLLIGVGAVVAGAMYFTTSKPEAEISRVTNAPIMKEPPGGKASPDFIAAQAQANEQRIKEAATSGMGTALPTPLPSGISTEARKEGDPLVEFRAEMKRQKEEQTRQIQALQQQTQQQQQVSLQQDQQVQEKIGASLTQQMTQLATLWQPKPMNVVAGMTQIHPATTISSDSSGQAGTSSANGPTTQQNAPASGAARKVKPLIPAGTVNYAQMLTEANSDVPGPILAQILSGPLSGARAIGKFVVNNDYMILTFNLAILRGKEYPIETLALDPDTTLGGMATEVDHRYFARVVLPAAASFISAFGQKLGTKPTETTVTSQGVVISSQAESGIKDAMYAGMGSVGQSLSNFFSQEASNTHVLVRVAVGTPMGLFFVKSVCGGEYPCEEKDVVVSTASSPLPTKATPASMTASGQ